MDSTSGYIPPKMPAQPSAEEIHRKLMLQQTQSQENFSMALVAGTAAAVVGALLWMAVTYFTHYQIGWMAVGVGFLVGLAIRTVGKGSRPIFGILGAALALFGCMLGNLLTACVQVADQQQIGIGKVLGALNTDIVIELFKLAFSPMDLLFYGLAIWWGYKYSLTPSPRAAATETVPKSQS